MHTTERRLSYGLIAILVLAVLILLMCNHSRPALASHTSDTTYYRRYRQTPHYKPQPQTITVVLQDDRKPKVIIMPNEPVKVIEPTDTAAIINDYYARSYYSDTVNTAYGNVRINDSVSRNEIVSRQVETDFKLPVITNTNTLLQPKKLQLYLGAGVLGSYPSYIPHALGVNLSLKTFNDKMIEVQAYKQLQAGMYYGVEFKSKISLHK